MVGKMNLSCSSRMIKYLMFAFNLFFVISGIIIIAVGAAVKTVYSEYSGILDSQYFTLPNMLIATGALIFIVSFFGCCGAIKESWIMLGIFSIFLCIIFIFEFASGIAGYVLRDKTTDYLESSLRNNIGNYNSTHGIWDLIQDNFHCCGVDNYTDWRRIFPDEYALPISCCPFVSGVAGEFYCNARGTATSPATDSSTELSTNTTNPISTPAPGNLSSTTITSTSSSETPVSTSPTNPSDTTTTTEPVTQPGGRRRREVPEIGQNDATTLTPTPGGASTSAPYPIGCKSAFGDYIEKHAVQIGGCALGLAVIQILGILFSCHLVRQLKNGYYST